MYESKYSKYLIQNTNRFATKEEIIGFSRPNRKENKEKYSGVPVFYDGECLYVDNSDAHYLEDGMTGSKKSRTSVINTILSVIASGEHGVITDPKGELYKKTAGSAEKEGYNILVLNLRTPKRSHSWNPMYLPYMLDIREKKDEAEEMLNDFIYSLTSPLKEATKDTYWSDRANDALSGKAKLLMDSVPAQYFNISTLMQVAKKKNKYSLEEIIGRCDEKQPFLDSLESLLRMSAEKTQDCIYDVIKQAFGPYSGKSGLLNILCGNEIDFAELTDKNKKTLIYIIYPDEKKSMAFLVNLFLSQCYFYLMMYLSDNRLPCLEKRVNFICEEFGNLPKVEGFSNRISEARGYNIRYFLCVQSYGQLENIYKEDAKTIKGNCDWIIYPSKETAFLREVSELCGNVRDCQLGLRPLISVDRIQHLKKYQDGAEAVVIKSGQYPFIVKMPDYEYIDIFERGEDAVLEDRERSFYDSTLTMSEWLGGINEGKFNQPFPKHKRLLDRRIPSEGRVNKKKTPLKENE